MTSSSWKAFVEQRNTFAHVIFADDENDEGYDETGPLRKCRSEPHLCLAKCFVDESSVRVMVDQFAAIAGGVIRGKCSSFSSETTSTAEPNEAPEMPSEDSRSEENDQDMVEEVGRTSRGARRRKIRPCKGQRLRRQKFIDRLRQMIDDNPEGFEVESVQMPPSLAGDTPRGVQALVKMLQEYKYQALREREIENILHPLLQFNPQQYTVRVGQDW